MPSSSGSGVLLGVSISGHIARVVAFSAASEERVCGRWVGSALASELDSTMASFSSVARTPSRSGEEELETAARTGSAASMCPCVIAAFEES